MIKVKYPENIELKKKLKKGDLKLIARTTRKSESLVQKIFTGSRRMKPEVKRAYDTVVRFNQELERTLGCRLEAEMTTVKNQMYKNGQQGKHSIPGNRNRELQLERFENYKGAYRSQGRHGCNSGT